MVDFQCKEKYYIDDYRAIMTLLRGKDGCPWDAVQTHESIRRNMLEEAYEAVAAIDKRDMENLCEELGDLQMQILFHACIEEEKGGFSFDDVCDVACKKLIHRHPHVFGGSVVDNAEQVLVNWETIKQKEKSQTTTAKAMEDVTETLPALWRAEKIQKKAKKVGFDWPDWQGARDKLLEEVGELTQAVADGEGIQEELGDILAAAVNLSRLLCVDPEKALHGSCDRFVKRFRFMEEEAQRRGDELAALALDEQENLWQLAKKQS